MPGWALDLPSRRSATGAKPQGGGRLSSLAKKLRTYLKPAVLVVDEGAPAAVARQGQHARPARLGPLRSVAQSSPRLTRASQRWLGVRGRRAGQPILNRLLHNCEVVDALVPKTGIHVCLRSPARPAGEMLIDPGLDLTTRLRQQLDDAGLDGQHQDAFRGFNWQAFLAARP